MGLASLTVKATACDIIYYNTMSEYTVYVQLSYEVLRQGNIFIELAGVVATKNVIPRSTTGWGGCSEKIAAIFFILEIYIYY